MPGWIHLHFINQRVWWLFKGTSINVWNPPSFFFKLSFFNLKIFSKIPRKLFKFQTLKLTQFRETLIYSFRPCKIIFDSFLAHIKLQFQKLLHTSIQFCLMIHLKYLNEMTHFIVCLSIKENSVNKKPFWVRISLEAFHYDFCFNVKSISGSSTFFIWMERITHLFSIEI